jgi:hypothetical protein
LTIVDKIASQTEISSTATAFMLLVHDEISAFMDRLGLENWMERIISGAKPPVNLKYGLSFDSSGQIPGF